MQVDRIALVEKLKALSIGTGSEGIEYSNCYMFSQDRVFVYNGMVLASMPFLVDEPVRCAVLGKPLLSVLNAWTDDSVKIEFFDELVELKAGRKRSLVPVESDSVVKISDMEKCLEWKELPARFPEALGLVGTCTHKNRDLTLSCVHISNTMVEACNNTQAARFPLPDYGLSEDLLLDGQTCRELGKYDLTHYGVSSSWVFFRVKDIQICVRRSEGIYRSLDIVFDRGGMPIVLPSAMAGAIKACEVFAPIELQIDLKPGSARLKGSGPNGSTQEVFDMDYKGDPVSFRIKTKVLKHLLTKTSRKCTLSKHALMVTGDFEFVTTVE